jgi:hypothetical protein
MIALTCTNLNWLGDTPEVQLKDQCAHGDVAFRVNDIEFLPLTDCNLTATGLYLLRTLESNHSESNSVTDGTNLLFAHCGHGLFPSKDSKHGFVISGCNHVADFAITHEGAMVVIVGKDGKREKVSIDDWKSAVLAFAMKVQEFYDTQPQRTAPAIPSAPSSSSSIAGLITTWHQRARSFCGCSRCHIRSRRLSVSRRAPESGAPTRSKIPRKPRRTSALNSKTSERANAPAEQVVGEGAGCDETKRGDDAHSGDEVAHVTLQASRS